MKQQNRFTMIALVSEYIGLNVRGFSFVSGWIEQYKQANKETLGLYNVVCSVVV